MKVAPSSQASAPSNQTAPPGPATTPDPASGPDPAAAAAELPPGTSRPRRHFPCFDGFRAIAAISVVGVHTAFISGFTGRSQWGDYTSRLEIGVSVFFLISGFLLYRPFAAAHLNGRSGPRPGSFLRRRFLRIFPLYWVVLFFSAYGVHAIQVKTPKALFLYTFLLQIYSRQYILTGIQAAWSLCTEMSFYFFLPLWAWLVFRRWSWSRTEPRTPRQQMRVELLGIAGLIVLCQAFKVMIVAAAPPMWQIMPSTLPGWIDLFGLGMALAVVSSWTAEHGDEPAIASRRWAPWAAWILAGVCFWAVSTRIGLPRTPLYDATLAQYLERQALYGAFAFFLLLPGIFGPQELGLIRAVLQNRAMQLAGLISYGIYLWHETLITKVLAWFHRKDFQVSFPKLFAGILVATLAVSAVTYIAVERPFLRMKDRRILRLRERRTLRAAIE